MEVAEFEERKQKEDKFAYNKRNEHERDAKILFVEDRDKGIHDYHVKGDSSVYTSVSKLYKKFFPEFDEEAVIDGMMSKNNWPQSKYFGMTKEEIKMQWKETRDTASRLGAEMHNDIEYHINYIPVNNDSVEFKYFLNFYENLKKYPGFQPCRTEWRIYDEKLKIAGSIDFVMKHVVTGQIMLLDWKRSAKLSQITRFQYGYPPFSHLPNCPRSLYSMQLNVYRAILEKNYGLDITRMLLVAFHPDLPTYEIVEVGFIPIDLKQMVEMRK